MVSLPSPDPRTIAKALRVLAPLERALRCEISGLEHLEPGDGPRMFVGNHQLLALDSPLLVAQIYRATGVPLRAFVDDFFFWVPPIGHAIERLGAVRACPENAHALIEQGAWILVYPGGAREAAKLEGHPYELDWWGRLGFAEVALQHRCTVIPVAARGIDGAFDYVLPGESWQDSSFGSLLDRLGVRRDIRFSVAVPRRLPHVRFRLCEPVVIDHFWGHDHDTNCRRLRAEVGTAIQRGLEALDRHPASPVP